VKPGRDADGVAQTEADHFGKCSGCGQWDGAAFWPAIAVSAPAIISILTFDN